MSEHRDPVERALDVLIFAPIGAGLFLKDMAPSIVDTLVTRGRDAVDRRVTTARSLGQVAVAFGAPIVRERVQARVEDALGRTSRTTTSTPTPAPEPVAETTPPITFNTNVHIPPAAPPTVVPPMAPSPGPAQPVNGDAPASADLPIPGYDALSASQVVERLSGLGRDELDAVHAYETAHRQRRTILGKIEQLAG